LIFVLIEKKDPEVRFHAWQSIGLFGGWTIVDLVLSVAKGFLPGAIDVVLGLVLLLASIGIFILWIVLMIQTYQGKKMVLPVVGPWAEQQVANGTLA
jgi:uncharacterized membrane protein